MQSMIIEGPSRIHGQVTIGGNKNAVLPMIAAAMLTEEEVILHNVPDIIDVENMLHLAAELGADVKRDGGTVVIKAENLKTNRLPKEICSALRTSLLFAGPLAARTGKAELWPPGGDIIGRRRLDAHFYGLRKLGIQIESDDIPFEFKKRAAARPRTLIFSSMRQASPQLNIS